MIELLERGMIIIEFTRKQIRMTKGVAILFMLLLHLFCTREYEGLFKPLIYIGDLPLVYYLALFGDCCVAIFCFCSGYGLMANYQQNKLNYSAQNRRRLFNLYFNYWIVIFLFVCILGPILGRSSNYPGSLKDFILTVTALNPSYNGAWWFVTTYILLVITSPILYRVIMKYNAYLVSGVTLIIYIIAYIQRIKTPLLFDLEIMNWLFRQLALYGTSLLPFVIGGVFYQYRLYSKLTLMMNQIKFKNFLCISLIILMIVAHGIVQTLFVAVFTGITFICLFNLIDKPRWLEQILEYFAHHSTNMWLNHMFFYMIYFKELVYFPQNPILIFMWLIILSLIGSYITNYVMSFCREYLIPPVLSKRQKLMD